MHEATSDSAWVQAMLDVEAALARARAAVGLISSDAASAIAAACRADAFDIEALGLDARRNGNPAIALVASLRAAVGDTWAAAVHAGATSQDVMDTAMVLVIRNALDLVVVDLNAATSAIA